MMSVVVDQKGNAMEMRGSNCCIGTVKRGEVSMREGYVMNIEDLPWK